jgi:AraC family transcriptional regulator, regulatory protein of adaptative response / DNA-3-methyladenine glycosylase II
MLLDPDSCFRAYQARDSRFDGRFFVGVTSTGIYCRPICTAKLPAPQNCRYFPSAAAAEQAGFRPCLVCRPELAPGMSSADAKRRLAFAAMRLIAEGSLEESGLSGLGERLGITTRHLRRIFKNEFGVSPAAFAQTQRLLLAKRLLSDTAMPITDVAFASGFGSLRRFNALFQGRYRLAPSALRKAGGKREPSDATMLELGYRPPYDWDAIMGFLATRTIGGVEDVDAAGYRRTLCLTAKGIAHAGWLGIAKAPGKNALQISLSTSLMPVLPAVLARAAQLMDLSCEPLTVAEGLKAWPMAMKAYACPEPWTDSKWPFGLSSASK